MSTPSCIQPDILAGWLHGQIETDCSDSIDDHIEQCSVCQAELERLTTFRILPRDVSPLGEHLRRFAATMPELLNSGDNSEVSVGALPIAEGPSRPLPEIPGYEMIRLAGRGGIGRVYLARQTGLNRLVAIKVISDERADDWLLVNRLREEARAVASLRHPNIVQVHDVVETNGLPAIVLEYIDGGSLASATLGERLSPSEASRIVGQIARGVHAAHERGIIHRDLKPANILMDGSTPKVTDFGLALNTASNERLTTSGEVFGTPEYMAPEQIREGSRNSSPQSDVYSLGAILYELLTGHPPFVGSTVYQTMELITHTVPVPPAAQVTGIPEGLSRICMTALEKDPQKRFDSANSLERALTEFSSQPITSVPIPLGSSSAASARQLPLKVRRLVLLTVLLSGIGMVAGWYFFGSAKHQNHSLTQSVESPGVQAGSPADLDLDLLPTGSLWQGTFTFLPAEEDRVDGDMELAIESRAANEFQGISYSEGRQYAWRVNGHLRGNTVEWVYVSAIRDNAEGSVVGNVQVTGTIDDDVIHAEWNQQQQTKRFRARLQMRRRQ